jgi:hypothetical protein
VPLAFPDQRLVRPGDNLDRLSDGTVAGGRAQLVPVGAHHVGQGVRVGRIALGPGYGVPLPVPGYLQRVDRVHPVAGGEQRPHPRTPVGLDAHHLKGATS